MYIQIPFRRKKGVARNGEHFTYVADTERRDEAALDVVDAIKACGLRDEERASTSNHVSHAASRVAAYVPAFGVVEAVPGSILLNI